MKGIKTLLSYLLFIVGLQWKSVYALDEHACPAGDFMCKNKECIVSSWQCDGEKDCSDGSDEIACSNKRRRKCDESVNFRCKNDKCVPKSWTCDRVDDCGDNSDESSIDGPLCLRTEQCARNDFKCVTSGACILQSFYCDGFENCDDGSDEKSCDQRTCTEDEFRCDNARCISKKWHCDRSDDCGDMSDERNCRTESCDSDQFQCTKSKHCIRISYKCDGSPDCLDGSDEHNCSKTFSSTPTATSTVPMTKKTMTDDSTTSLSTKYQTTTNITTTTTKAPCRNYEFMCPSTQQCIHNTWLCDGALDCDNGEDERITVCKVNTCQSDEFRCDNGQCIDRLYKCDQSPDCTDGSDEKGCPTIKIPCTKESYTCQNTNNTCIDHTLLCNGKSDCPDGDDESDLCGINECAVNNGGCSHHCDNLILGHRCSCRSGFNLAADQKMCDDINECEIPGMCTQACINYKGSYACMCDRGYNLDPLNKKTCRAQAPVPYLLFTNRYDIREISTNGHHYNTIISNVKSAVAISLDIKNNMIYWIDNANKTICRASRTPGKESNVEILVNSGLGKPEDLAVDWVGRKLYWTDSLHNCISVSNLDGSHVKSFYNATSEQQLRAVTVYPEKGLIYWTDWGKMPKIQRANLDGSDKRTVVNKTHVSWPVSIAIDNTLERLYWTDLSRRRICSSSIDGSMVQKVVTDLSSPYGLTVFEEYVYWTDFSEQKLYKANKFNGKSLKKFKSSFFQPMDISVFHPLVQKEVDHPCQTNNGYCSHLCFISLSSEKQYVCGCPDFLYLDKTGKNCVLSKNVKTLPPGLCKSDNCQEPTVARVKNKSNFKIYIYIGLAFVFILLLIVITVVIYRRRRNRFDLRMIYETRSELVQTKDNKKDVEVEVKYVTNQTHTSHKRNNKNFDNINFREMDEAKVPLHMSEMDGDFMVDNSDNSSDDVEFDDKKPIIPQMV